jgi:hypothetical protein
MEQLVFNRTGFREILDLRIFRKSIEKTQVSLKADKNNVRALYMETNVRF